MYGQNVQRARLRSFRCETRRWHNGIGQLAVKTARNVSKRTIPSHRFIPYALRCPKIL